MAREREAKLNGTPKPAISEDQSRDDNDRSPFYMTKSASFNGSRLSRQFRAQMANTEKPHLNDDITFKLESIESRIKAKRESRRQSLRASAERLISLSQSNSASALRRQLDDARQYEQLQTYLDSAALIRKAAKSRQKLRDNSKTILEN